MRKVRIVAILFCLWLGALSVSLTSNADQQPAVLEAFCVIDVGLSTDYAVPCSPANLMKEGVRLNVSGVEGRMVESLLKSGKRRSFVAPTDVRLAILGEGVEPLYVDPYGDVTQGKRSWQLNPRSFLKLYLAVEQLRNAASKQTENGAIKSKRG